MVFIFLAYFTLVLSLGQEDPLEEERAPYFSILAWESHGERSLLGYRPGSLKKVGHDLETKQHAIEERPQQKPMKWTRLFPDRCSLKRRTGFYDPENLAY